MKDILIGTWAWGTGANGSSMVFGSKQDPEILKQSFEEAVKLGFTNWDTAAVYGMGSCEKLLGTLIKGRDDIFISTKFFPPKKYKQGELTKSFNESMERLGRDNADLFWIHVPNNLEANIMEALKLVEKYISDNKEEYVLFLRNDLQHQRGKYIITTQEYIYYSYLLYGKDRSNKILEEYQDLYHIPENAIEQLKLLYHMDIMDFYPW